MGQVAGNSEGLRYSNLQSEQGELAKGQNCHPYAGAIA